jgi:hypothetical protein
VSNLAEVDAVSRPRMYSQLGNPVTYGPAITHIACADSGKSGVDGCGCLNISKRAEPLFKWALSARKHKHLDVAFANVHFLLYTTVYTLSTTARSDTYGIG